MKLTQKQQELAKQYRVKQAQEAIKQTQKGATTYEKRNPLAAQLLRALDTNSLLQRAQEKESRYHPRPGTKLFDEIQFSVNEVWKRKASEDDD